jgi:ankyrin repeat protein
MDMPTSPGSSGNEDVNAKDKDGRTALIEAAATGNTDRIKALIAPNNSESDTLLACSPALQHFLFSTVPAGFFLQAGGIAARLAH